MVREKITAANDRARAARRSSLGGPQPDEVRSYVRSFALAWGLSTIRHNMHVVHEIDDIEVREDTTPITVNASSSTPVGSNRRQIIVRTKTGGTRMFEVSFREVM